MSIELAVFDLDLTLWDCGGLWCDCLTPPFEKQAGVVTDSRGLVVRLYDDVRRIMDWCDENELPMALASRTDEPAWARELLGLLEIDHRFAYSEIYPSSKLRHFRALHEDSGIGYQQMVFFDDEMRNITECSTLGVNCVHVKSGMHWELFHEAM